MQLKRIVSLIGHWFDLSKHIYSLLRNLQSVQGEIVEQVGALVVKRRKEKIKLIVGAAVYLLVQSTLARIQSAVQ